MVRIIDIDDCLDDHHAIRRWWSVTTVHCEQFFKAVSQFDVRQVNAEYLIRLQMSYISFERTPFPPTVKRAREILLNSMFAVIDATTAALGGDSDKSRGGMKQAFAGLLTLKKELLSLGITLS